jgi:hypothetical protein
MIAGQVIGFGVPGQQGRGPEGALGDRKVGEQGIAQVAEGAGGGDLGIGIAQLAGEGLEVDVKDPLAAHREVHPRRGQGPPPA